MVSVGGRGGGLNTGPKLVVVSMKTRNRSRVDRRRQAKKLFSGVKGRNPGDGAREGNW